MSEKQQRLVYSIIEFLNQSIKDGTVKADDQESLDVASKFFVSIPAINPHLTWNSPVHRGGLWRRSYK